MRIKTTINEAIVKSIIDHAKSIKANAVEFREALVGFRTLLADQKASEPKEAKATTPRVSKNTLKVREVLNRLELSPELESRVKFAEVSQRTFTKRKTQESSTRWFANVKIHTEKGTVVRRAIAQTEEGAWEFLRDLIVSK